MKCPKCGCQLDGPAQGRNSGKWFVKHTFGSLLRDSITWCPYIGKHWGFHDTEEQAIAAVTADESSWRPVDCESLAFINQLIEIERDKSRREKLKGVMAG